MEFGNSYFRDQLSGAYKMARALVPDHKTEIEYILKAKAGIQSARDVLFQLYIPMVIKFALSDQYKSYEGELGDLVSSAMIGFNRALALFDPSTGNEFGCFYKWHAMAHMNKEMYNDDHKVNIPENLQKSTKDEHGRSRYKSPVTVISADTPLNKEDGCSETILDRMAAENNHVGELAESNERESVIGEIMDSLPAMEADAVQSMIMDDNRESSRDFGDRHGVSHEWARRLKNKALKRIKARLEALSVDETVAV